MSLVVFGLLAAAAAGLGGALAARMLARRRAAARRTPPALPAAESPRAEPALALDVGDVVQHGDSTRWPRAGIAIHHDGELYAAVLLSDDAGHEQATVVFAPPRRELLWLQAVELMLPATPPSRLEIDGHLLDRRAVLAVELSARGEPAPAVDPIGTAAFYDGTLGDAALVLLGAGEPRVYHGRRLDSDAYDVLGRVDGAGSDA